MQPGAGFVGGVWRGRATVWRSGRALATERRARSTTGPPPRTRSSVRSPAGRLAGIRDFERLGSPGREAGLEAVEGADQHRRLGLRPACGRRRVPGGEDALAEMIEASVGAQ